MCAYLTLLLWRRWFSMNYNQSILLCSSHKTFMRKIKKIHRLDVNQKQEVAVVEKVGDSTKIALCYECKEVSVKRLRYNL